MLARYCLFVVAAGCLDSCISSAEPGIVELAATTEITLAETDTTFVSVPSQLAVDSSGNMAISDVQQSAVLMFDRNGAFTRQLGRRGSGPGEFKTPSWLAFAGNSVIVNNLSRRRLLRFAFPGGSFLGETPLPFPSGPMRAWRDHLLVLGEPDSAMGPFTELSALDSTASTRRLGWVPAIYHRFPYLGQGFGSAAFELRGDTVIVAFELSDQLYRYVLTSGVDELRVDSTAMTRRFRRGARGELFSDGLKDQSRALEAVYGVSIPVAVTRTKAGMQVAVYMDVDRVGSRFSGRIYVNWADAGAQKSCAEARLVLPTDPRPTVTVARDTLYALTQESLSATTSRSAIRKFPLDKLTCRAS